MTTNSFAPSATSSLKVEFASTDFSALLSQVANKQFDVGSSSISTTDARRKTVGFTNGYDFGYMAVVTKSDAKVTGFADLKEGVRIGVVKGPFKMTMSRTLSSSSPCVSLTTTPFMAT